MSAALAGAPASTRRLFAHYEVTDLGDGARVFVIGRLLEEGERDDLAWLAGEIGEEALVDWMRTSAPRQLSRRSRAFWSTVLGTDAPDDNGDALWLL